MKLKIYSALLFLGFTSLQAQTYPHSNINLVGYLNPETVAVGGGQKYSGCWGWWQDSTTKGSTKVVANTEYALIGSVAGTYFVDIKNPANPVVRDYVPGKTPSTWRELKVYKNYCYVISDVVQPNTYQIIDMQYLPDSVHVVYEGTSLFERGHATWIDNNRWYVSGLRYLNGTSRSMEVYSLATPTAPTLIRGLYQDAAVPGYVHDMFCINDTVFASGGNQGLHVFRLTGANTFSALGSMTGYPEAGYNHSSYITSNRKTLIFCDEVPSNLSIKSADVSNLSNITMNALFRPNMNTQMVAHNPYVVGNKWAFVSCYQDGLVLYNISNPSAPTLAGYFDTYPQGGANAGNNYGGSSYAGNWGAYPYYKSNLILALDMQNGIFILEAFGLTGNPLNVNTTPDNSMAATVYPNPASNAVGISFKNEDIKDYTVEIKNMLGDVVLKETETNSSSNDFIQKRVDVSSLAGGVYMISVNADNKSFQQKIVISR